MGRYLWEVLLFEVLNILIFYPTHHRSYQVVVLAATIYTVIRIYATPDIATPLLYVGGRIPSHFLFTVYILGTEGPFPDHWRRVRDEVHGEAGAGSSDNRPSNFPVTKKLWWMLDLTYSPRMVGWVQEPRGYIPPPPPPSRRKFLWKTLGKFIANAIIVDLLTLFPRYPASDSVPENTLGEVSVLRRFPYIVALCCTLAHGIDLVHNLAALVCVGLGGSSPTLWPDMMGRWRDAYTVRKFWQYVCRGISRFPCH